MRFSWFFIICLWMVYTAFAVEEGTYTHPKLGLLDIFTKHKTPLHGLDIFSKPKIPIPGLDLLTKPKPPTGFQINKQFVAHSPFGGGSFGFGFGFGGHTGGAPGAGVNIPPKDKPEHGKPEDSWEEPVKEDIGHRPNRGGEKEEKPKSELYEDKGKPKPESHENKDQPKPESHKDKEDLRPDWEDIGEMENRSDDLMDGDLVGDGLIQPRLNKDRVKRFIESKIYHVALKRGFVSNARVSKVKFRRNENSLNSGM